MIVLNVTYRCRPGVRDEFLKRIVAEGIDTATRAEEGNWKYDYYLPVDGGDELLLLEKWRDEAALAEHRGMAHFARLGEIKAELGIESLFEKFERE